MLTDRTLEANIAPGLALHDVSASMPQGHHQRATRRPSGYELRWLFVHHSGALGRAGVDGAIASADYTIRKRNFPGPAYHFWVPFESLVDDHGRLVVLRLVPDDVRAWHTGGICNDFGHGLALQGNTTKFGLSYAQVEALEGFLPWYADAYGHPWVDLSSWLGWHSIARRFGARKNKANCPGYGAEAHLAHLLASAA